MAAMRLAAYVEHTTDVDGMLDTMTPQQFAEWQAFDSLEPLGDRGTHDILAMIGCLISGYMQATDERGDDIGPYHFTHWREKPKHCNAGARQLSAMLQAMGARKSG
jgi:hypothetical protein